jgi:hypothetical protein
MRFALWRHTLPPCYRDTPDFRITPETDIGLRRGIGRKGPTSDIEAATKRLLLISS